MSKRRSVISGMSVVFLVTALLAGVLFSGSLPGAAAADTAVFINEIHYDNEATDANEAIEIAGPAGTDLAGWSLILYNGNGGVVYNTTVLSGVIPDQQNGFGTVNFPISGIQNGAPDGVALVNSSSAVIQFLSYEGSFTATDGLASGMVSTDIGVSESLSTLVGFSLQLQGTGSVYEDFVWAGPMAHTYDAVNTGQSFQASGPNLMITKSAPSAVMVGETFTYTLVTSNSTGGVLSNVVITDSLPLSVTVLSVSDSGVELPGNVVSWTVASLADGAAVTRTVNVEAPAVNTQLVNADYAAVSPDWPAPAVGILTNTDVGGELVDVGDARGMLGEIVTLSGRATMYTGGFYAGTDDAKFYVQDATGGIAVQCFDQNGLPPEVTLGDWVTVTGKIGAYNNEVQIVPGDNVEDVTIVDGTPADVPAPLDVALADFNSSNTMGWLSRIQGQVMRVQEYSYRYEVDISDGINTVLVYVDKDTTIDMGGVYPYSYYEVTGIAEGYSAGFELKPRIQADFVEITPEALLVYKEAPGLAVSGTVYNYTIVATNNTTETLNNLVITDTVPAANAVVAEVMDGGVLVGDTITWTVSTLATGEAVEARFAMTATGSAGDVITNTNYAAWADEWAISARGPAVETEITAGCDPGDIPIYTVQGSGDASPLDGTDVQICGVVIGVSSGLKGFFLQDPTGDGNAATSDGIFVYRSSQPFAFLQVGDLVEVFGEADEYYGVTQLQASSSGHTLTVMADDQSLPTVASLNPPADRTAADTYLEAVEGMLVEVPITVTVVGPTNYYGEYYVVRGDTGLTRLVRNTNPPDGYRLGVDDGLSSSDDYVVGDVLRGLYGPLHYTYDNWKIEQAHQPTAVSLADVPDALPQYPPAGMYDVTMGAFNVLNFDGLDDALKLTKVVSSIIAMGPPTFLSLEEIAVEDTWAVYDSYTVTGVIEDVLGALAAEGYNYDYAYSHADVGGHGVAVLYDTDVVQLDGVDTLQGCSTNGSGSASNYDNFCDALVDEDPLFSRRPVVVTGTLASTVPPTQITFIGAHLKSGFGSASDIQRRLEQAQLVAAYVADLIDDGQPNVVVAGDLNDFLDSQTLDALETTGTLTNTFYTLPPEARYSYIYNGGAQVLDHILVSPVLFAAMTDFQPVHIDADYPAAWEVDSDEVFGVSDHDPVVATFALVEPAVVTLSKEIVGRSGAGSGTLLYGGGMVTYTITLSNTSDVDALNVQLEDVLPAQLLFDAWIDNAAGAVAAGNTITWTGTVLAQTQVAFTFQATVLLYDNTVLMPVVNTATFTADNALGGEDSATFDLGVWAKIFLPLVMQSYTP